MRSGGTRMRHTDRGWGGTRDARKGCLAGSGDTGRELEDAIEGWRDGRGERV